MQVISYFVSLADTVRGLGVIPDLGVLSASHDGLVFHPLFCLIYGIFYLF